ncbi:50S ribosomal protein L20 [Candidatus Saccharibacteria bacterium]|nr:50S ribosomal protein L20 [Candidatus Saccharibacteria bacterium]NIV03423.1 50S ribosomal protein L20 [Calditrichia bacterium]NIV71642.1 50S ribosomal protein L20 [Calditrichia bacterium]NIV98261.1 50S ribosomal protein L20 [Candidatus Saccharibacteria bacterium]NIW78524.1 50S ribosomal protein L20 [Calditrichia bacterium]
MPRAKNNVAAKQRHKKILKMAKGYRLGKHRLYRTAKDQVEKSLQYAYRDRRLKKRHFRRLWISRINAACRLNGITYSRLIHGLRENNVELDRKTLAHLAMHEPHAFKALVEQVAG